MMSTAYIKQSADDKDKHRQELLSKLNWNVRTSYLRSRTCNSDVSISMSKAGSNHRPNMDVYLRNGVADLIDNNIGRLSAAFIENRVYFMAREDGYKISDSKSPDRKTIRMSKIEGFEKFIGDYDLKYDSFLELYYVEKESKK